MKRSIWKILVFAPLLALISGPMANLKADFTASGTFQYQDRELYRGGFTGDEPYLPIRLADVEVLDSTSSEILATGYTDSVGYFSISVPDNQTRDIVVRVLTTTDYVPYSNRITMEWTGGWNSNPYALESPVYSNHNPNSDLDIGTIGAPYGNQSNAPGKPFNIFDAQLNEMTWVKAVEGGNPNDYPIFKARWKDGMAPGQAYYDGAGISIGSELAYDDCVILHEGGHFTNAHWSRDNNPGGSHYLGDNNQDPRLSYGEGIATWYACVTREYTGVNPAPHLYINTTGAPGAGNLSFSYDVENPSGSWYGPADEVVVTSLIWDIVDGEDTNDDDPGVDDDSLNLPYSEVWDVLAGYLPTYGNPRTIEDFWDGWFDPSINNDHEPEMIDIFEHFQIEYYEDALEPDNNTTQATPLNFQDDPVHHTLYGVDDEDWQRLDIINNASFNLRSADRLPATYPEITVYESDGVTEVASNSSDITQPVLFDGVGAGPYYAKVLQQHGFGIYTEYGHFNLQYSITAAPPESAAIDLSPAALIETAPVGVTVSDTAIISNVGGGPLHFSLSDKDRFSGDPSDLPWMTEEPSSGTVDPGDSAIITISFITDGLTPDSSYDALMVVESNDIVNPEEELIVRLTTQINGIGQGDGTSSSSSLPRAFSLAQNYPNPFNPSTSIAYDVPVGYKDGVKVVLEVFNIRGQRVSTLVNDHKTPGSYVINWNGKDDAGRRVGSGIYIYRIKAGDFTSTKKMVILK